MIHVSGMLLVYLQLRKVVSNLYIDEHMDNIYDIYNNDDCQKVRYTIIKHQLEVE